MLAGLVAATGADASDGRGTPSDGAPRPIADTPSGIEILLGGKSTAQPGEAEPPSAGAAMSAVKALPAGKLAPASAGSSEPYEAASKPAVPGAKQSEPEPDAGQLAAGQTLSVVQMQPALPPAPAEWSLPLPGESVSLSGGQASVASEKILPAEPETGLKLPEPRVTVRVSNQPNGPTETEAFPLRVARVADQQSPEAQTASAKGIPAAEKADELGPGQPNAAENLDVAVAAMAVRAAVTAPVESPPANTDRTDPSIRRAAGAQASEQTSRRSSGSVVAQVLALRGLVPQTVDSIPPVEAAPQPVETPAAPCASPEQRANAQPAAPARATAQSLAESLVPAADTQVRVLASSTPDRDEIAFALQMKATPTSEHPAQRESPVKLAAAEASRQSPTPAPDREGTAPESAAASENRPSPSGEPDDAPRRDGRERHPEVTPPERTETPAATPAGKMIPHAAPDAQVRAETAAERPDTTAAKPVRLQDAMESETKSEAARANPVRDMKFEVTSGERRVEVRLSERGGEVKMTVRTPDANLASTLRENLPALSARLAESGLKSEAWHPAASSPNERRYTAESSAGGASQDANSQPRQQDREPKHGTGQGRPQCPQEPILQKQKGRDFAWLMSSLR